MKSTIEKIEALIDLAEKINPTVIYNEGWMIRLLVMESRIEKLNIKGIDFEKLATKNWSSEALITSPFVKTKKKREGYTHTDIILGDFSVNYEKRGEVNVDSSPKILGIIEAKMGSNLSQRTSNAENYNQASRNICCLSFVTKEYPDCEIFFMLTAPEITPRIETDINQTTILGQIKERFELSEEEYLQNIQKQVEKCKIISISYKEWIDEIHDNKVKKKLDDFYEKCKTYNRVK